MDLLAGLTPEQREAVLHTEGPLLIVAGAGSGKTRVITRRVARLIHDGIARDSILAITFTNKAAGEMRERIADLVPPRKGLEGPWVSTFHSFAVRILRENAERLGYGRDFSILDPDDQLSLVRECMVAARVDVEEFRPWDIAHRISRAKELLDDEAFVRGAADSTDLAAARTLPIYREKARSRNAFDFDDLVAGVVLLLEKNQDVREALLDRVRFVLIDEYQDTNHAQYRLARILAGERKNLAVCGDPDQSIYAWRGADMRNILRFEEDYPSAKVIRLEKNYRSTATILKASNALIANNKERRDKQLVPTGVEGGAVEVHRCLDEDHEADYVARRVEEVVALGTPRSEVAVIYRANALSRRYEEALMRRGVPFATKGSVSFYDRREIKDALAYLRLAANPRDDIAALRALRTPPRGLGERSLDKIHAYQREKGTSLVEACGRAHEIAGLSPHAKGALAEFAGLARDLHAGSGGSVERLVATTIERTKLDEHYRGEEGDREGALKALVDAGREADRRGGGGARGFLDRLSLLDTQDSSEEEKKDKVTLMTIHASKGLEYDVVIVVALEEGIFPHQRALEEGQLEEERRLAYVAFTRAKKRLVLTYAGFRGGRTQKRQPSIFLTELPRELLWDPERRVVPEIILEETKPVVAAQPSETVPLPSAEAPRKKLWATGLSTPSTAAPRPAAASPSPRLVGGSATAVAPTTATASSSTFSRGQRVKHARLGLGEVLSVGDSPNGPRVRVRLGMGCERWLLVASEPLEKV